MPGTASAIPRAAPTLRRQRALSNLNDAAAKAHPSGHPGTAGGTSCIRAPQSQVLNESAGQRAVSAQSQPRNRRDIGPSQQPLPLRLPSEAPRTNLKSVPSASAPSLPSLESTPHPQERTQIPQKERRGRRENQERTSNVSHTSSEPKPPADETLAGPLSLDAVAKLGARIQKLAAKHNITPEHAEFLQQFAEDSSSTTCVDSSEQPAEERLVEDDITTAVSGSLEEDEDELSSGELSPELLYPSGADHVDFRFAESSVSLLLDRLDAMTPVPEIPPVSHAPVKPEPQLRKKRTMAQLIEGLGGLEQIEAALLEAIRIKESADTVVENLELELKNRVEAAEDLVLKKGVTVPASGEPASAPKSIPGIPSILAVIKELPGPKPLSTPRQVRKRSRDLTDSERETILEQVREEKKLDSATRWDIARKNGAAEMFLTGYRK